MKEKKKNYCFSFLALQYLFIELEVDESIQFFSNTKLVRTILNNYSVLNSDAHLSLRLLCLSFFRDRCFSSPAELSSVLVE